MELGINRFPTIFALLGKKTPEQVVTTYDTLASDFNASGGEEAFSAAAAAASSQACRKRKRTHGLMSLGWHRVVLDEAHTIRNPKTGKHKVCVYVMPMFLHVQCPHAEKEMLR